MLGDNDTNLHYIADSALRLGQGGDRQAKMQKHFKEIIHHNYQAVIFLIAYGEVCDGFLKKLKELVRTDPVARGDPSKFKHTVILLGNGTEYVDQE